MKIIIATVILLISGFALAGDLTRDGNRNIVQGFAPDGAFSQLLTVNPTTVNLTDRLMYSIYTPTGTTCFARLMPLSTSTKASYVKTPIPVGTWVTKVKNPSSPFLNLSGCAAGYVELH